MASDHRTEATDDDRVDVDAGRLEERPPEQRNHRHSATRGIEPSRLELADVKRFESGVVLLTYRPAS